MMKKELEQKAKSLKDTAPEEALVIYREIWDIHNDEFNSWDALFTIQCLRKSNSKDTDWAFELAEKFPEEKVLNLFAWLVFDKLVKNEEKQGLINNESKILKMAQIVPQKNLREDNSFPCPVTISIFKLCDVFAENLFNANKINEALSYLNPEYLKQQPKTIETENRGSLELSSEYEKYFALKNKALFKLGEFKECIEKCKKALDTITDFHNNNDLWFKMRIALSEDRIGNHTKGEELLEEILKSKVGSDKWFLYRDIAEIYFEQKDYIKAWKFSVEATYYGNEPHFLIGLFLLQAKILFKLNRPDEGKLFAELIASILKENNWGEKQEYRRLFDFYKINIETLDSVRNLFSKAQLFWNKERYGDLPHTKGVVISIHGNGKKGRIKDDNGIIIDFHKKDLIKKLRTIESLKGSEVEFYSIKLISGELRAESIKVISEMKNETKSDLTGKQFNGIVKSITDFGVFIKLEGLRDGLLHKKNFKSLNFNDFSLGTQVHVKIVNVSDKGISLEIA